MTEGGRCEGRSNGDGGHPFWVFLIKLVVQGTGVAWAHWIGWVVDHAAFLFMKHDAKCTEDESVDEVEEPAVDRERVGLVDVNLNFFGNDVTMVVDGGVVVV